MNRQLDSVYIYSNDYKVALKALPCESAEVSVRSLPDKGRFKYVICIGSSYFSSSGNYLDRETAFLVGVGSLARLYSDITGGVYSISYSPERLIEEISELKREIK